MALSSLFESIARSVLYPFLRALLGNQTVPVPLSSKALRRILVLRYDRLGDMVVTTPIFDFLKKHCPNATIDVVASHRNAGLLAADSRIERVWHLDGTRKPLDVLRSAWTLSQSIPHEYDAVVCLVFHKTTLAGIIARWVGGRKAITITLGHSLRQEQYAALFSVLAPLEADGSCSMAELQLKIVSHALGVPYTQEDMQYRIALGKKNRHYAERVFMPFQDRSVLLMNLSPGKAECRWTYEGYHHLCSMITQEFPDIAILLSAMPDEAEWAEELHQLYPDTTLYLRATGDVLDFCAVVERVDYVVTPDTSVVHIAQAFAKPMLALYSGIYYCKEWAPIQDNVRVLVSPPDTPTSVLAPTDVIHTIRDLLSAS